MAATLDDLRAAGANVDEGLGRCMDNEDLYLRLVATTIDDPNFATLSDALAQGNVQAAFEASHALKGVLANLALTQLAGPMSELCEILRAGGTDGADALLSTIQARREELTRA